MPPTTLTRRRIGYGVLFLWVGFFIWFWPRLYYQNADGIFASNRIVWADWAVHTTFATRFAHYPRSEWFTVHPLFADGPFNYPFLSALISGLLLRLGLNYQWSMDVPCIIWTSLVLLFLFAIYRRVLRSELRASVGITMALVGGGMGFLAYFSDLLHAANPGEMLYNPHREYQTLGDVDIDFGSTLGNLFIPQRALQLGLVFGLAVILILWWVSDHPTQRRAGISLQCLAGVLLGLLPIVHVHSFISVSAAAAAMLLAEIRSLKRYLPFIASAAILSLTLLFIFHRKSATENFLGWQPGWLTNPSHNLKSGFLFFWWLNWSFFLPLVIYALARTRMRREPLVWAGVLLFVLANLIRFQPWDWDNTKIFVWSYFLLVPAAVETLGRIWRGGSWAARATTIVLAFALTGSGFIDLWRISHTELNTLNMYTADEMDLGRKFAKIFVPSDRVLVVDDHHDWVSALAGGQILMGYDGWVNSWGFPVGPMQNDIRLLYAGGPESLELLRKHKITYIVISGRTHWRYPTNEDFFQKRFPLLFELGDTDVYQVTSQGINFAER